MDKFQIDKNKHRPWQQCFLYPVLFQEDLYAIAHDNDLDKSSFSEPLENFLSKEFSFLTVKRLIRRIRQQNNSIVLSGNCDPNEMINRNQNSYSELILESLAVVSEVSFSMRSKPFLEGINEWKSFRSIHCLFPFMEDKLPHTNYISDIRIPYSIHPEILVRTFRRWMRDVPSLHLLRSILHEWRDSSSTENLQKALVVSGEKTKFSLFLWNSYVYEWESILIPLLKRSSHSRSLLSGFFPDRTLFDQKIKHIVVFPHQISTKRIWLLKDPFIHYLRYEERSLLVLKGTQLQVKKCRYHLFKFWQCSFHLWAQPYRIWIHELSKNCSSFLGYFLSVKMKPLVVRAKMLDRLFINDLITNELRPIAPISSIIRFFAKERFCVISGRPISKLAWTSLTDDDILDRFDRIWRNLFHHYSGSFNQEGLYYIKYILLLSCAKTLACKHKSTIRVVREELGSELFTKSFSKKREFISSSFSKTSSQRELNWNGDILQINPLANSWQKIQNKK
uniref:Maturase K n=4 Tax=Sciadopitys verticillata TaxID=28979 RepID=MATK_SCIVE|nr:maturase K [Sciadopitys verticillata]Q9MVV9.1 RecName: Full=Maturase K; AltName: Full=Intron maturase [Sciadopitys verticillata]AFJ38985.1 maturase K [Sciadopitys verticillata]AFJ38986.1 maturase K [Sciadopitys verticillata]AFJ38987.1 maturase K [Sciadopitys verticillata]AMO00711.1 maturase K [Sciadopitys verticillata]BAA86045.1 maturase K [Sciadopitys verticillata]